MILLNETLVAEKIIESGKLSNKPMTDLGLVTRYLFTKNELNESEIKNELLNILSKNYDNYDSIFWDKNLDNCIQNNKEYQIKDFEYVPITENELETIKSIGNKKLEKLAFTVLVIAKYYNMKNDKNNNFVNEEYSEIFKLARVTGTIMQQPLMLNDLKQLGLVERSKRITNTNFKVNFIDNNSPIILKVTDLRELGYVYLEYIGEHFIHCAECGILMRQKNNKHKYCKSCAVYQPELTKTVTCVDCGKEFEVSGDNKRTIRCDECQSVYRKKVINDNAKRYYANSKK